MLKFLNVGFQIALGQIADTDNLKWSIVVYVKMVCQVYNYLSNSHAPTVVTLCLSREASHVQTNTQGLTKTYNAIIPRMVGRQIASTNQRIKKRINEFGVVDVRVW
jgi:hypothetical protein